MAQTSAPPNERLAVREFVESLIDAYGEDVCGTTVGGESIARYWFRKLYPSFGDGPKCSVCRGEGSFDGERGVCHECC